MSEGVSVVICCYNGAGRLPETLRHLALQEVPAEIPWEIILIDNASTDETGRLGNEIWQKLNSKSCTLTILEESTPGKNYAFRKGVAAARYDYILTCDDDNWLNPAYVALAFRIMNADPTIGALGGCGIFEPQQPLNPEIEPYTAYFVNGSQVWADTEHWVYGAGSVYRKSIFNDLIKHGWQQITTGRKGKSLICGEDVEICFMIYLTGYKIIKDDNLTFRHFVDYKRQSEAYIIDLCFWLSYTHVLLNSYYPIISHDKRPIEKIINGWLKGSSKTLLKNILSLFYQRLITREQISTAQRLLFSSNYGTFRSLLKNRVKIINHHRQVKQLLSGL